MRKLTPLITSAALLLSSSLFAATIRIPQDQPNIQWGINAASNGDTVLVDRGAYAVNVNFNGKRIVLKSAWGVDSTILSPAVNGIPIISIVTGEDISTTVEGFRFLRGHAANGGAILFNNSSGRVLNSVFDACRAPNGAGGSIACFGNSSRVQVFNSIFKNGLGGVWNGLADALYSSGATVDFSRNLVINNSSNAVIYATANSHVKIINNTIAQTSNSSVALSVVDGSVGDLRNNIFFDNPAGSLLDNDLVTVEYNDFYLSPAGPFFGPGNISKDPLFEGGAPFSYRLQPSSPCIDVGDPKTPVPPLGGTRVDMGVFEFPGGIPIVGPDPRDSIIVESKTIAADSGTGGIVRLRVWITNKDTLANVTLPLVEKSISGEAQMLPVHPRDFNGTIVRLTNTLPTNSVANYSRFNGVLPDSFVVTSFFDPTDIANTAEPPNAVRKPLWEIRFDTIRVEAPTGEVQFDTVRFFSFSVSFVDLQANTVPVNFVRGNVAVHSRIPTMPLALPLKDARVPLRRPTLVWYLPRDSSLTIVPATYRAFFSADSSFSIAESSSMLTDTSWRVPVTLGWNQKYFWKAIALTLAGDTIYSKPRAFFVGQTGDLDGDGIISLTDVVLEIDCVFGTIGNCSLNLTDTDCSGSLSPVDIVWILNIVFREYTPLC